MTSEETFYSDYWKGKQETAESAFLFLACSTFYRYTHKVISFSSKPLGLFHFWHHLMLAFPDKFSTYRFMDWVTISVFCFIVAYFSNHRELKVHWKVFSFSWGYLIKGARHRTNYITWDSRCLSGDVSLHVDTKSSSIISRHNWLQPAGSH